jgi:hypothetical protein
MPGPTPKDPRTRQRRNRTATQANLPPASETLENEVPALPKRDDKQPWHHMVVEWWKSVWRSPMSQEFLDADMRGGLYLLADLHQLRWTSETNRQLIDVAKEIRLQEQRFGLSPIDRRRLQWEVARGEEAERRRKRPPPKPQSASSDDDPRRGLRAV